MVDRRPHSSETDPERRAEARRLAELALHEQATGHVAEADRLLARAQELDPDTVAEVLVEHDAGRAPDARLQETADRDVERVLPRIVPRAEPSEE